MFLLSASFSISQQVRGPRSSLHTLTRLARAGARLVPECFLGHCLQTRQDKSRTSAARRGRAPNNKCSRPKPGACGAIGKADGETWNTSGSEGMSKFTLHGLMKRMLSIFSGIDISLWMALFTSVAVYFAVHIIRSILSSGLGIGLLDFVEQLSLSFIGGFIFWCLADHLAKQRTIQKNRADFDQSLVRVVVRALTVLRRSMHLAIESGWDPKSHSQGDVLGDITIGDTLLKSIRNNEGTALRRFRKLSADGFDDLLRWLREAELLEDEVDYITRLALHECRRIIEIAEEKSSDPYTKTSTRMEAMLRVCANISMHYSMRHHSKQGMVPRVMRGVAVIKIGEFLQTADGEVAQSMLRPFDPSLFTGTASDREMKMAIKECLHVLLQRSLTA